jgi:DNA-binding transcriptional LysR family regulator
MNKFQAMTVFTRVAECNGFSAAGRKMGMSASAVTKMVGRLEDDLGVQLFNRTTRRLALTDFGQEFYARSVRILSELEDAESTLRDASETPRGVIRAVVPFSFGRVTLMPALPRFCEEYPDINLDLTFNDAPVDLIEEGFDVGVRTGLLNDSRLMTRVLTRGQQVTFAAPCYLEKRGVPQTPDDLQEHVCLVNRFGQEWSFADSDNTVFNVAVPASHTIWSGDALREAVVAGLGISQATWWLVRKDLEAGTVVPVLDDYACAGRPVSVLYPANRHLPRKVRAFIDFLVEITRNEEA